MGQGTQTGGNPQSGHSWRRGEEEPGQQKDQGIDLGADEDIGDSEDEDEKTPRDPDQSGVGVSEQGSGDRGEY